MTLKLKVTNKETSDDKNTLPIAEKTMSTAPNNIVEQPVRTSLMLSRRQEESREEMSDSEALNDYLFHVQKLQPI